MSTRTESPIRREPSVATSIVVAALLVLWHAVRIPIFVVLRLAEPLVQLLLGALGLLSILGALFYKFLSPLPHPPFLLLMGFAVACGVTLLIYEALLRLLSR
jgi:hypothetical protein